MALVVGSLAALGFIAYSSTQHAALLEHTDAAPRQTPQLPLARDSFFPPVDSADFVLTTDWGNAKFHPAPGYPQPFLGVAGEPIWALQNPRTGAIVFKRGLSPYQGQGEGN